MMDEVWEKAVETALEGQTDPSSVRSLTMDGVVKCVHGRLPPPSVFERFRNLRHLSIASIGVSSLECFPRLQNLQKLILSDNRISGGLEFLVKAGLHSLRDLDLSNNRIQDVRDLSPLAKLKLVSLDLYECPVTRVKDYRSSVLGLVESLKFLDKTDAEGNERPESDDEEDDEESDEEEDDYDTGSVEVDCEDGSHRATCNGRQSWNDRVIEVDDDESDAEDAELDTSRGASETSPNRAHNLPNGVRVAGDEDDEDGGEDDEDSDWDEDDDVDNEEDDDDDVLEVHNVVDDDDDDDEDDVEDEEEVDNDDFGEKQSTDVLASTEGEIDGDGEDSDSDEDDSVETGEENSDDEEEDNGAGYLVQPVGSVVANGMMHEEEDVEEDEEDDDDGEVHEMPSLKRKRDPDVEEEDDDDDDEVHEMPSLKRKRDPEVEEEEGDDDDDDDSDDGDDDDDGVLENGKCR
ncbi:unnamed protein product [Cuscuta campestris]|uniref:U2A'/phosphoprotein 32 family A C-terminal domain-containing protein n=1 Tax=Cuscuta campestris TaxID=132261 RepID=A0A484MAE2_9ASTE|nr:unnamed protein product [Cuscuta campestris]